MLDRDFREAPGVAAGLDAWLAYVDSLNPVWDLGLARVGRVAEAMRVNRPAPLVVTITGTNGKGSTAVCLEQVMLAAGWRTGCTLSPHVERFNERIRINGRELPDAEIVRAFAAVEAARGGADLTYFEFSCLAALYCFLAAGVEVAILEIGLGGRLDAFNLVDAQIAVVTSIGLDHCDYLGDTREAIGAEKAGIFRRGQSILLGPDMPRSVIEAAQAATTRIHQVGRDLQVTQTQGDWSLRFDGQSLDHLPETPFVLDNCALAVAAALLAEPCSAAVVRQGLALARMPARCEVIETQGRLHLLDVAHNPLAAAWLARELARRWPGAGVVAVFGNLQDKDSAGIFVELGHLVRHWLLVDTPGPRGLSAADLASRCPAAPHTLAPSVEAALVEARSLARASDVILVFGSFVLAQAARLALMQSADQSSLPADA